MAENIFDFRHVDVYCQYYSFKNDISYKSAKSLWNGKCIAVYADNAAGEKNQGRGKNYREVQLLRHDLKRYLVTYRQLLQEGKYEVIEADIDKILGKRLNTNHCVYTENTILNAVICEKMEQCSIKNIKIEVQVNADKDMDSIERWAKRIDLKVGFGS